MTWRSWKNGGNGKFLEPNENEGTADKDFQDIAKVVLRGQCIAVSIHVKTLKL